MSNPPFLFIVFFLLCGVLLVIRNFYYFKLWRLRNNIDNNELRLKIFRAGIQKFILPIIISEKIDDLYANRILKIVNFYNVLAILSFIISGIAFFNG